MENETNEQTAPETSGRVSLSKRIKEKGILAKSSDFVEEVIVETAEMVGTTLRSTRKILGAVETALDEVKIDLQESYIIRRQEALVLFESMGYSKEDAVTLLSVREK